MKYLTPETRAQEEAAQRRLFVLQIVQPGLAGLMDGSVSTLAPLFAAAFATHKSWDAFLVGLAASVGAGISMGFAEALSDDGSLTGRGHPWVRGIVCGIMTTAGGIGHTLPFLISNFKIAISAAVAIVAVELAAISFVRHRYMDTPFLNAAFQVVVGGVLVFLAGISDREFVNSRGCHSGGFDPRRGTKIARIVTPAKAGVHCCLGVPWIPAFAGMTFLGLILLE